MFLSISCRRILVCALWSFQRSCWPRRSLVKDNHQRFHRICHPVQKIIFININSTFKYKRKTIKKWLIEKKTRSIHICYIIIQNTEITYMYHIGYTRLSYRYIIYWPEDQLENCDKVLQAWLFQLLLKSVMSWHSFMEIVYWTHTSRVHTK